MKHKIINPNYVNEKKVKKAVDSLVHKYFFKVVNEVVIFEVKNDLMKYKKYEELNGHEMTETFLRACDRLGELVEEKEIEEHFRDFGSCGL